MTDVVSYEISPQTTLAALRQLLLREMMRVKPGEPVPIERDMIVSIAIGLDGVIDQIDALAEGSAAADRLVQELAIARAEIGRLETRLEVRAAIPRLDNLRAAPTDVVDALRRSAPRGATIVDYTEVFAREQAANRGVAPTGGDVA